MRTVSPVFVLLIVFAGRSAAGSGVSFTREIAPILLRKCTGCHGERANQGGFRAHNFQALMKRGASGVAAIVPGKPESSRLFRLISTKIEPLRMPKSDDSLNAQQIDLIRRWIAEGAAFDGPDVGAPLKSLSGPRVHPASPSSYRSAVPIMSLALFPGGGQIAVGGYNEITVWDTRTSALVRRIPNLPQRIQALSFSRDGGTLLVAGGTPGEYGEVALIDVVSGRRTRVLDTWTDICQSAVYSPDGARIAAGGADSTVRAYEAGSGKRLWTSGVHSDSVTSVSFSADGQFVASASRDMTVKINEASTGNLFTTYSGHNRQIGRFAEHASVYAVRFDPEGKDAFSAGAGKWLQKWNPEDAKAESGDAGDMEERFSKQGHAQHIPLGFQNEVFALVVRGGQVFASSADGSVKQFDLRSLREVRTYKANTDYLFTIDFDPISHRLASGSYSGQVTVWDTTSGQKVCNFQAQPRPRHPIYP